MYDYGQNVTDMMIKDQGDLMLKVMQLANVEKDIIRKQLKNKQNNQLAMLQHLILQQSSDHFRKQTAQSFCNIRSTFPEMTGHRCSYLWSKEQNSKFSSVL